MVETNAVQVATTTPPGLDSLETELADHRRSWDADARWLSWLHVATRVALIVASATVAARDQLAPALSALVPWVPVLALLVSIVTALDTWFKPATRAQSYLANRDDVADLQLRMKLRPATTADECLAFEAEWEQILRRHRDQTALG